MAERGGGNKETGASRLRPKSAIDPVEWKNMFDDDDALVSVSVKLAAGPAAMVAAELVILYILGLRLSDQHQFPFNAPYHPLDIDSSICNGSTTNTTGRKKTTREN